MAWLLIYERLFEEVLKKSKSKILQFLCLIHKLIVITKPIQVRLINLFPMLLHHHHHKLSHCSHWKYKCFRKKGWRTSPRGRKQLQRLLHHLEGQIGRNELWQTLCQRGGVESSSYVRVSFSTSIANLRGSIIFCRN